MCFLGRGTHITRDMCLPGRGRNITRAKCFSGRGKIRPKQNRRKKSLTCMTGYECCPDGGCNLQVAC